MPKSLTRIIVLLLIPCLVADPVTATALVNPLSPGGRGRSPVAVGVRGDIVYFQEQALMLPFAFVTRVLEQVSRIRRTMSDLVHRLLHQTEEPIDSPAAARSGLGDLCIRIRFWWITQVHHKFPWEAEELLAGRSGTATYDNLIVVRFRGKNIALCGQPSTGKSATARHLIRKAGGMLVAHQHGFLYFHHSDVRRLYIREASKFDGEPLEVIPGPEERQRDQIKGFKSEDDILPTGEIVRIDTVVLIDPYPDRQAPADKLKSDVELIASESPWYDFVAEKLWDLWSMCAVPKDQHLPVLNSLKKERKMPLIYMLRTSMQEEDDIFAARAERLIKLLEQIFPVPAAAPQTDHRSKSSA